MNERTRDSLNLPRARTSYSGKRKLPRRKTVIQLTRSELEMVRDIMILGQENISQ